MSRYIRNIVLKEIGVVGQGRLLAARVIVIGTGGLGSPVLYYLAAAGIGNLTIIDDDVVEISNLQRQILHNSQDLGRLKIDSAEEKLTKLNPDVKINKFSIRADYENISGIISDYDLVVDCPDNFETRYEISKVCMNAGKPYIFGAVKNWTGHFGIFKPYIDGNPCYRCFNSSDLSSKNLPIEEKGIFGAVAGVIGSMQAILAAKEILGLNERYDRIGVFDIMKQKFRSINIEKDSSCECNLNSAE